MHSLILQRLDQCVRNFGRNVFYPPDVFRDVDYTGRPLILFEGEGKPYHPPFAEIDAGRVPSGYRVVGSIANTSIDGDYQRADAYVSDPALDAEITAHPERFAVSTGFWGDIANDVMRRVIGTNHVMIFRRDPQNRPGYQPNDQYSQVVNSSANNAEIWPESLESGVMRQITMTDTNTSLAPSAVPVSNTDAVPVSNAPAPEPGVASADASEIDALRTENTELKAMLAQLLTRMQEMGINAPAAAPTAPAPVAVANSAAQAEIDTLRKKCADYEWRELECKIPQTMRGPTGRAAYEADPAGFMRQALVTGVTGSVPIGNTAASGETIAPPTAAPKTFLTPEYCSSRGIALPVGNTASGDPKTAIEGKYLGNNTWGLYGGMKLNLTGLVRK